MVFYAVLTLRLLLSYSEAYIADVLVQGSSVLEEVRALRMRRLF